MYQYSSQLYGTEWESYMGISNLDKVVGSEQLSFEPTKSPFNIVTTPLQITPPGFCASAIKSLVSFQAQQQQQHAHHQHQIEVPAAWCFEFPKTTTTTDTHMVMNNICQASGDNFTTKQDRPSSQFTSSFLSSSGADCRSSSEKYCKIASYSEEKHSSIQPDSIQYYDLYSQEDDKLLRDDAATDEGPLEISFQRNQVHLLLS